jgi:hypothetical protein
MCNNSMHVEGVAASTGQIVCVITGTRYMHWTLFECMTQTNLEGIVRMHDPVMYALVRSMTQTAQVSIDKRHDATTDTDEIRCPTGRMNDIIGQFASNDPFVKRV